MKTPLAALLALFLAGCGADLRSGDELDSKVEYSVLQGLEIDYRLRENSLPYVISKDAMGSGFDVIGLPRKGGNQGYVWLIANPGSEPVIKQMPSDADFLIDRDVLVVLDDAVRLDSAVRAYLSTRIEP